MTDIKLPYDTAAETGLIGTLIINPNFCVQIGWFKADYLYHLENKCIFWAISELAKEDIKNIDDFNIIKKITENKKVQSIFDELKIPSIQDLLEGYKIVARNTIEEYRMLVNRVTNLAYKRRAYQVATNFSKSCLTDNNVNLNELNLQFHDEMNKLAEKFIINQEVVAISDVIDEIWAEIEESRQGGIIGIPSKYDFLNEYITYQPSELVVVGGRAKAGKSTFFLNEAHHKLKLGLSVAIFDTEMKTRRLLPRMLALESGLTIKEIERGLYKGDTAKEKKLQAAYDWWKNVVGKRFVHIYDPCWSFDKIYATAKMLKIKRDFDLSFLIFDYIKDTGSKDFVGDKKNYLLGDFTNFLKNNIAGELDIPVLTGAQMSPYDVRLADSDDINRYASVVAYWMRKNKDDVKRDGENDAGNFKFIIDYSRLGEIMDKEEGYGINFDFDGDRCLVEQAKYQQLRNAREFENLGDNDDEQQGG